MFHFYVIDNNNDEEEEEGGEDDVTDWHCAKIMVNLLVYTYDKMATGRPIR